MRTDFRNFLGEARPLDDIDLPRLGYRIGVGEDEIHAVIDVEAAGGAWDARGRPKMLFEPHRFYKNLGPGEKRDRAVMAGLAYVRWGEKPYPKDSYPRLIEAMAIDETAALKSASWGLGQVLGENHAMVGYDTVQDMVLDTLDDADKHLEMMVAFILSAKLDGKLRAHDWAGFARGYNGPQYAKHGYHTRLAAAYNRWSKIRDTPWSPADDVIRVPVPTPRPEPVVTHEPPVRENQPALPVTHDTPLTPLEQMNKPVQGAKANVGAAGLGGLVLSLWVASGYFPSGWETPEMMAALGALFTTGPGIIANFIASYRAPDKRFASAAP